SFSGKSSQRKLIGSTEQGDADSQHENQLDEHEDQRQRKRRHPDAPQHTPHHLPPLLLGKVSETKLTTWRRGRVRKLLFHEPHSPRGTMRRTPVSTSTPR